ncbi:MAG: nicotianamine synthase family protein [Desulfobacteraceae bacterium]|jgi:hypothetical protein
MKTDLLSQIKIKFEKIYRSIENFSDEEILRGEKDLFSPHLEHLNRIAAMDVDDHLAEILLEDTGFQSMISRIARVKRLNSIRIEAQQVQSVLQSVRPWETLAGFGYYPNYLKLAQMEYQGADLTPGDRVAFLGSGPLPLSLILLCKSYDIDGVGIELETENVALSRDLIEKLDLDQRIRILQGNHLAFPLENDCQLIMIGAEALPKDEIFSHLAQVLSPCTKLSYRIFEKGLRRLLDDHSVFRLPHLFKEYKRVRPQPPVNNTVVFIIKEK